MKALVQTKLGKVDLIEIPPPASPEKGGVILKIEQVALNHLDVYAYRGMQFSVRSLPSVAGCEAVGTIEAMGKGVSGWLKGDRVVVYPGEVCHSCDKCDAGLHNHCRSTKGIRGFTIDGFASEFVSVDARNLIRVPQDVLSEHAVCAPIGFGTPQHMLFDNADLQPGETVLVHSAGSGIGSAAIMLSKAAGARVLATVGHADKIARAYQIGADIVILRSTENFVKIAKQETGKNGVNVVFEHVGRNTFAKSLLSLGRGGRLVTCGATSGTQAEINLMHLFNRQIRIQGSFGCNMGNIKSVLAKMEAGITPAIDCVIERVDWQNAISRLQASSVFGKIILRM